MTIDAPERSAVAIRPITQLNREDLQRLMTGYTSDERYLVHKTEADAATSFRLELVRLEHPYVKHYDAPDEATFGTYQAALQHGLSLGVYASDRLIGVALAESHLWNRSLWVMEFHVAAAYRNRGIGRRLMDDLAQRSRAAGLRIMACETQNTNVPAIRFYRKAGFTLDGIDLSYYSNHDWPDGEIAFFMKRQLQP